MRLMLLFGIIFFIIMGVSAVLAFKNQETNGSVSTGYVDINIQPLDISEETTVMPGDDIKITPKIENRGAECYLRVKISYINEDTDFLDYVSGFNERFEKYGEYYYLIDVFKANEVVELFSGIKIPVDVSQFRCRQENRAQDYR